jgi:hypothetical protein
MTTAFEILALICSADTETIHRFFYHRGVDALDTASFTAASADMTADC